uniref:Uncharacterized protein n=1 Tax=Lepeophtheirus salmonis TaxID=72036 RepID=A0A0K2UWC0_LEPSM
MKNDQIFPYIASLVGSQSLVAAFNSFTIKRFYHSQIRRKKGRSVENEGSHYLHTILGQQIYFHVMPHLLFVLTFSPTMKVRYIFPLASKKKG